MKRCVLPLVLVLALPSFLPQSVRGQTPPPPPRTPSVAVSPTATAAPGVTAAAGTDARATLEMMQRAIIAAGTLHYSFGGTALAPNKRQVVMTNGGTMSFPNNAFQESRTIVRTRLNRKPYISVIERSELKAIGQKASWRVPHMSWQCESLRSTRVSTNLLVFGVTPIAAEFRGAGTVNSVPVWHIRARAMIDAWTANRVDTVQYDVSQASHLPIRVWTSFPIALNGAKATQTLTESYSHYGETVHITLPAKCATTGGH